MAQSYCGKCGNAIQPKDRFCRKCGSPLDSTDASTKHPPPISSLSSEQQQKDNDIKFISKCATIGAVILILLDIVVGISQGGFVVTGLYIAAFIGGVVGGGVGMAIASSRRKR